MKFKNIIFLVLFVGCTSANSVNQKDFIFYTESFSYQWTRSIYNSELNQYVRKTYSDPDKIVTIILSDSEKDSLKTISENNFSQCIKNDDKDSKISYVTRINKLTYKGKVALKKCDTIDADNNWINTSEFKYYQKFRQILNSKSTYQDAFPVEFEIY